MSDYQIESSPQGQTQTQPQAQAQGSQESASLGWRAGLPKEYQSHDAFSKYSKVGDLAKDFLDMRDRSQRALYLPHDKSTDDERKQFLTALGVPTGPEGYTAPEGYDAEAFKQAQAQFYKYGLTAKQANAIMKDALEQQKGQASQKAEAEKAEQAKRQALQAEKLKALQGEWGDQFDTRREYSHRGLKSVVDEAQFNQLSESGLINEPWFIKLMHSVGETLGEDKFIRASNASPPKNKGLLIDYGD